jgi:dolichol-phosphate mannosyltransferase
MTDPAQTESAVYLSVVAPAYNEVDNLSALVAEVAAAAETVGRPWEFVLVNDCSDDGSDELFKRLMAQTPQLRVITMSKRSGQTAALEAGLRNARGTFIATLDSDLQNDPAEIPRMVKLLDEGECDMVNGWRKERNDPWLRRASTKIANGVRNRLTRESIHDSACGLKAYRREVTDKLKLFNGLHRFLPTLAKMNGFRVTEIAVNHRPRTAGVAKYGMWNRVFKALRDTFAIRWMQKRNLLYDTTELERNDG